MPNHITNKITAAPHVIAALLNDDGMVDFQRIIAFPGRWKWDYVSGRAEQFAEKVIGVPFSSNPLIALLEDGNRNFATFADVANHGDEEFEQFIQMLRNFRICGRMHSMDFAREAWGTKWNAYDQTVAEDRTTAQFDTAWSTPQPVFVELSKRFPEERIKVVFADEDTGSNCGTFVLLNGETVESDIAPAWHEQSEAEHEKWIAFAHQVKGYVHDEDDVEG